MAPVKTKQISASRLENYKMGLPAEISVLFLDLRRRGPSALFFDNGIKCRFAANYITSDLNLRHKMPCLQVQSWASHSINFHCLFIDTVAKNV